MENTDNSYRRNIKKDKLNAEELRSLVQRLISFEKSLGEDYFILIQLKTLQFMVKEIQKTYNVDLENLRSIFQSIIDDEERHMQIVRTIEEPIPQEEQEILSIDAPLVKYQNPDAWYRQK